MKKLSFLLLIILTALSCSSDDSNNSNLKSFNPPSWIHGSWSNGVGGFKFTDNNVCIFLSNSTDNCLKELSEYYTELGADFVIDEEVKSDKEYKFSYSIQGVSQYYHFVKQSDNQIKDILSNNLLSKK